MIMTRNLPTLKIISNIIFLVSIFILPAQMQGETSSRKKYRPNYSASQVAIASFTNVAASAIALVQGADPAQCILNIIQSIFNVALAAVDDDEDDKVNEVVLRKIKSLVKKSLATLSAKEYATIKKRIAVLVKRNKKKDTVHCSCTSHE